MKKTLSLLLLVFLAFSRMSIGFHSAFLFCNISVVANCIESFIHSGCRGLAGRGVKKEKGPTRSNNFRRAVFFLLTHSLSRGSLPLSRSSSSLFFLAFASRFCPSLTPPPPTLSPQGTSSSPGPVPPRAEFVKRREAERRERRNRRVCSFLPIIIYFCIIIVNGVHRFEPCFLRI